MDAALVFGVVPSAFGQPATWVFSGESNAIPPSRICEGGQVVNYLVAITLPSLWESLGFTEPCSCCRPSLERARIARSGAPHG